MGNQMYCETVNTLELPAMMEAFLQLICLA